MVHVTHPHPCPVGFAFEDARLTSQASKTSLTWADCQSAVRPTHCAAENMDTVAEKPVEARKAQEQTS